MSVNNDTLHHSSLLDDEFISCENCLILFEKNEREQRPYNGDGCRHSFCHPCIESFSNFNIKFFSKCSKCTLSKEKSEKHNPDWCSNCNKAGCLDCHEGKHVIQNIDELFIEHSQKLKVIVDQTNLACDRTLKDFHDIQSLHKVILAWIGWLQQKISQWNSSNAATIEQLESLKTKGGFQVTPQKDISTAMTLINQLIIEFDGKHVLARTLLLKSTKLIHMYRNAKWGTTQSVQLSSFDELSTIPLANWFSTALSRDHKSCRDVLSFLVRLLNKEELVPGKTTATYYSGNETDLVKQNHEVKGNSFLKENTEEVNRKGTQQVRKRQPEEDSGSTKQLGKKARMQSPDRIDNEHKRVDFHLLISESAVNLAFKNEMKLQMAAMNEKLSKLASKLREAENKLKFMEEKVAALTEKKAPQLEEEEVPFVRLKTDLTLHAEKVELAEESKAVAIQESPILFKLAEGTEENYKMMLIISTADVEKLHFVRKRLEQSRSKLAIVFQEQTNAAAPERSKIPVIGKGSAEKPFSKLQKQIKELKDDLGKSTAEMIEVRQSNESLLLAKAQLQEEIRQAKEELQKLQSKTIAANANQEETQFRNYKIQLDELKIEFQKVVTESPIFHNRRHPTVAALNVLKRKMQSILKKAENHQVKEQKESEGKFNEEDHLLPASRKQRIFEMDSVQQTVEIWQHQTTPRQVQSRRVSSVGLKQKIGQLQVFKFNAIAENFVMELFNTGFRLRYHCCVICKLLVETRLQCNKCTGFILCIPCHQKEKHCHKMEILGFDLDVQELPADCKNIEEALDLKIERRINSLLHSLQCLDTYCREPFCKSMKLMIAHCRSCQFRATKWITESGFDSRSSCAICGELVALIIYHAELCTEPICQVPHCSSGRKRIRTTENKFLAIQKALRKRYIDEPLSEPRLSLTVNPALSVNTSHDSLSSDQQLEEYSSKMKIDVPAWSNQHVARVGPYGPGLPNGGEHHTTPSASDFKTRKRVQESINMIIHAHQCQQDWDQLQVCPFSYCLALRNVLQHVRTCDSQQSCIPYCQSTRMIVSHLRNCCQPNCLYCSVMTKEDRYDAITGPNPIVIGSRLPSSNIGSAAERLSDLPQLAVNYPRPSSSTCNTRTL